MVLGLEHVRVLCATKEESYALSASDLVAAVQEDLAAGLLPFYCCATIGTTSSCAVDPIGALGAVCAR